MSKSILFENLDKPFWILLIIIFVTVRHNNSYNPFLIIFIVFCLFSILLPSLFSRYVYRYNWPIFVTSFIPLGIILGQLFRYAWPLLITSSVRTSIFCGRLFAEAIAMMTNSGAEIKKENYYLINVIADWKIILYLFLLLYFLFLFYKVGKIRIEGGDNP